MLPKSSRRSFFRCSRAECLVLVDSEKTTCSICLFASIAHWPNGVSLQQKAVGSHFCSSSAALWSATSSTSIRGTVASAIRLRYLWSFSRCGGGPWSDPLRIIVSWLLLSCCRLSFEFFRQGVVWIFARITIYIRFSFQIYLRISYHIWSAAIRKPPTNDQLSNQPNSQNRKCHEWAQ